MNISRIILFLSLSLSCTAAAQTTKQLVDSARYYKTMDHSRSITFSTEAYKQAGRNKEIALQGESAMLLGVGNYLSGNYNDAIKWYFESEKIYTSVRNMAGLAELYNEMVIFYLKQKKVPQAKDASRKAVANAIAAKDTMKLANSFNNEGLIQLDEQKDDSAIVAFRYAYSMYKLAGGKMGMAYSLDYMASAFEERGAHDDALTCMLESKQLRIGLGDKTGAAIAVINIGELYLRSKKPHEAIPYFKEGIAEAKAINFPDLEVYASQLLAECYGTLGDYKEAFAAQKTYMDLNDKLLDQKRIKETEETQVKYETAKKEVQNKLLTEQNETQQVKLGRNRIAIYALSAISLLIAGLFYLLYSRYRLRQQARLKEIILEEQRLRAEDVLMAEENERKRIAADLHDGVGQIMSAAKMNLSAIQSQLKFTSDEQRLFFEGAIKMVDDGCKEVRVISHNMMPNALLKAGLTAAIREFVNMIPDRVLRVQLHAEGLDESLDKGTETVLYRVVQECVQNVIKHAQATHLDISLIKDSDGINIMVEDNGKGFDTGKPGYSEGLGTANMVKRISYLKGTVEWSSTPGNGTLVSIHVPRS